MQPVSLANLPEARTDVIAALQTLENSEENNWGLNRKASARDIFKFWSNSMVGNIEFAETIKEYLDLPECEKISLFTRNYAVFGWLPYAYKAYEMGLEGIPLGNGSYLPAKVEDYTHLQPEWRQLYGQVGSRLVNEVVGQMRDMALTREEYLLLRASALLSPVDSLSPGSRKSLEAAQSSLRAALNRTAKFMTDVDELFRKLGSIGAFEKDRLVNVAPNRQEEILLFIGATCAY